MPDFRPENVRTLLLIYPRKREHIYIRASGRITPVSLSNSISNYLQARVNRSI